MNASLSILMTGLIDYAGLFPPAALDMPTTLANWATYAGAENAWMLGRLIIPMNRLAEFHAALKNIELPPRGQDPWRVSALVGEQVDADIDRIFDFNRKMAPDPYPDPHPDHDPGAHPDPRPDPRHQHHASDIGAAQLTGGVVIDAIEIKATTGAQIDAVMRTVPEQLEPYFEIPVAPLGATPDLRSLITAMAGTGARAKIRTGGVTPEAFPAAREIARFIAACSAADVPFKATAGLHHPLRASYPLTYQPDSPCAVMFGFLNIFLAAAFVRAARLPEADAIALLEETNPKAFAFQEQGLTWRDKWLDAPRLARVRETFATSFGSCSFQEPIQGLADMNLL